MKYYSWLIRIAKINEICDMCSGIFRFSLPERWINGDKGISDSDEGIYKKINGKSFRRGNILKLPTICFYGIESKEDEFDIPTEYFSDFSKNTNEYAFIIIEANSFYCELIKYFNIEYNSKMIPRKGIEYVDKNSNFESKYDYPWELFYKNTTYSYQNEFRFILNFDQKSNEYVFLEKNLYKVKLNMCNIQYDTFKIPEENEIIHVKKDNKRIEIFTIEVRKDDIK